MHLFIFYLGLTIHPRPIEEKSSLIWFNKTSYNFWSTQLDNYLEGNCVLIFYIKMKNIFVIIIPLLSSHRLLSQEKISTKLYIYLEWNSHSIFKTIKDINILNWITCKNLFQLLEPLI